jgi:hypothetical protein
VKRLLNTLFVTTPGVSLRKDGENIVAEVDGAERARVPLHMLGSVIVFGAIFVSPPLIQALAGGGITLVLLDRAGRFQARVKGPISGKRCRQILLVDAAHQPQIVLAHRRRVPIQRGAGDFNSRLCATIDSSASPRSISNSRATCFMDQTFCEKNPALPSVPRSSHTAWPTAHRRP